MNVRILPKLQYDLDISPNILERKDISTDLRLAVFEFLSEFSL